MEDHNQIMRLHIMKSTHTHTCKHIEIFNNKYKYQPWIKRKRFSKAMTNWLYFQKGNQIQKQIVHRTETKHRTYELGIPNFIKQNQILRNILHNQSNQYIQQLGNSQIHQKPKIPPEKTKNSPKTTTINQFK